MESTDQDFFKTGVISMGIKALHDFHPSPIVADASTTPLSIRHFCWRNIGRKPEEFGSSRSRNKRHMQDEPACRVHAEVPFLSSFLSLWPLPTCRSQVDTQACPIVCPFTTSSRATVASSSFVPVPSHPPPIKQCSLRVVSSASACATSGRVCRGCLRRWKYFLVSMETDPPGTFEGGGWKPCGN
eukprot:scaffold68_cov340-Pavlova_lutheri.AAC.37